MVVPVHPKLIEAVRRLNAMPRVMAWPLYKCSPTIQHEFGRYVGPGEVGIILFEEKDDDEPEKCFICVSLT